MSFPIGPVDNQLFTTPNGAIYQYKAAENKWLKYTMQLGVTGAQGYTGFEGVTGLANILDEADFPPVVPAELLWSRSDEALYAGITGYGGHWIQISAGANQGATGYQGTTGLANILDEADFPTVVPVELLWNRADEALYAGVSGYGGHWVQISAGSFIGAAGATGVKGVNGIWGPTGIQGITGIKGAKSYAASVGSALQYRRGDGINYYRAIDNLGSGYNSAEYVVASAGIGILVTGIHMIAATIDAEFIGFTGSMEVGIAVDKGLGFPGPNYGNVRNYTIVNKTDDYTALIRQDMQLVGQYYYNGGTALEVGTYFYNTTLSGVTGGFRCRNFSIQGVSF